MAAETGTRAGRAPSGRVASRHFRSHLRPATANIQILIGTESGNAQMVAEAVKPVLEAPGSRSSSAQPLPDAQALAWIEGWKQLV